MKPHTIRQYKNRRVPLLILMGMLSGMAWPVLADETADFLRRHWAQPIAPQGRAPQSFSALEASLEPAACGTCHRRQWLDWQTSLHAHAVGPGLMGQLVDVPYTDVPALRDCTRCHAPLAEQEADLIQQLRGQKNHAALHQQGLVCAACHVRQHVRYGPPPPKPAPVGKPSGPHNGFVSAPAFEDGRFCATCHQFGADGYALNGKPLENTYAEWLASPYARQGKQCQSCHMPGRRHLWRGIHDAEMTRQGVTIEPVPPALRDGRVSAQLALTNRGTGHHFPTYVTPRVRMQIYQAAVDGTPLAGTLRELIIARQVTADLSAELSDTRLAPDAQAVLAYRIARHAAASEVVMRVRVEPDYFYSGLYRALLRSAPDGEGRALLQTALEHSLQSVYDLELLHYPLPTPTAQ